MLIMHLMIMVQKIPLIAQTASPTPLPSIILKSSILCSNVGTSSCLHVVIHFLFLVPTIFAVYFRNKLQKTLKVAYRRNFFL